MRMDRQTWQLTVDFRNFSNAPEDWSVNAVPGYKWNMNINTLCEQSVKLPNVKLDGKHSTRSTFESITQTKT